MGADTKPRNNKTSLTGRLFFIDVEISELIVISMNLNSERKTILNVKTNTEIDSEKDKENEDKKPSVEMEETLLMYVQRCKQDAITARNTSKVDEKLLDAQRRRAGEYSPQKKQEIASQGTSDIFIKKTQVKCNAGEAWISEIEANYGDKLWSIEPTPIPNLDDEVEKGIVDQVMSAYMQDINQCQQPTAEQIFEFASNIPTEDIESAIKKDAKTRAKKMQTLIRDQLAEGKWESVKQKLRTQTCTYGTGILKGPIVQMKRRLDFVDGKVTPIDEPIPILEVPHSPDIYPAPQSEEPNDGYMIERIFYSRGALSSMIGTSEYVNDLNIKYLLSIFNEIQGIEADDASRARLENKEPPPGAHKNQFECWEFWGDVPGKYLVEQGFSNLSAWKDYNFQVLWSSGKILKAMPNPCPLGGVPYSKAVYKEVVGSFWGDGIPHLMSDSQDLINSSGRNIVNNMGMSSGPQVGVDMSRISAGEDIEHQAPWKVWPFENPMGLTSPPILFFQPESNVRDLSMIWDRASSDSDNETGIPAYSYGSDSAAGAGKTASGLGMLMNAASRGIKEAIMRMDAAKIERIEALYTWNMLFSDDESVKGDAQVVAKGTIGVVLQEYRQQQISSLLDKMFNPTSLEIIGLDGFASLLRTYIDGLHIDVGDIVPTDEELKLYLKKKEQAIQQMQAAQAQGALPPQMQQALDGGSNGGQPPYIPQNQEQPQ